MIWPAGCDGWVEGKGRLRKNATRGLRGASSAGGNVEGVMSRPAIGGEPDDPSATSFVYNCVIFFAPVSMRRAYGSGSRSQLNSKAL